MNLRIRDPFIAEKLKSLQIVFNTHARKPPAAFALKNRMKGTLASLKTALNHSRKATLTDFVTELVACVPTFTNVRDLTIDCWDFPQADGYDLSSIYKGFWAAFGNNLECLTLMGNLESHNSVISSAPTLSSALRHLRIDFGENLYGSNPDTHHEILASVIAPFVRRLSPHLEGLKIWCWATLDMSPFFAACNSFPQLEYLAVRMAFDKTLREPSGLGALLCNTAKTVRQLEMRLNPSQFHTNVALEAELGRWLLECLSDEQCMLQVRELDLYPTSTGDGLAVVLTSVGRVSTTLRRLIIRDRYLVHTEVLEIIDALSACRGLRYLRMNVLRLDIDIMDRMAARLPSLEGLWLSLGDYNPTGLRSELLEALVARQYKWKVEDLSLWQGGAEVSVDVMRRFSAAIPGIESFFERGHKL
ncbi:hypothetical protein HYPSUDRAFT_43107 [Hypholoma sublateritium FD-334 SS-4]|uniref:F-box domain-containing protein n=1 Tax=Hypholoma sublateritium (strain FD-334 SS-4) TaxID=945553 RepID=A0A0D2L1L8_HYPSF|nr:hypothetical protein HYPSUDRAFT_43107 [Hypholoma sublateritium FD-334 SS-4]